MKNKLQVEAYESVLIHYIGIKTKAQIDLELTPIDNVSMQGYQKIERKRLSDLIALTDTKIEMVEKLIKEL